ncbi:Transposon protein [Phytophthora megakarya]|uniref:Transposon protein n=1 Tax=Phytophthora megakarya TaxID=4795 RepID=A0A225W1T2_9STRA|nr:Transposon protein [Phytophthora megakarya]
MERGYAATFDDLIALDEEYFLTYMTRGDAMNAKPKRGGSVPGQRAGKERGFWGECLMNGYFGENLTNDASYSENK